jgi:hypothetical protein
MKDKVKRVTLCGVQGCCPEVQVTKNKIVITDDDGGKVTLNRAQWNELKKIED